MAPGVLCREGFLGSDARRLSDILDADAAEVARLGLSHAAVAAELERVLNAAVHGLGTPVQIGERRVATWHEAMGRIPCPFGRCGTFPKGEVEFVNTQTGERMVFTPLSVHAVAEHGFYQGRGSRYRLEPASLARMLTLA